MSKDQYFDGHNNRYFKNKHNGRIVKIIEAEMTDSGIILYAIQEWDDGGKKGVNYTSEYAIAQHWDEIEFPYGNPDDDACDTHSQTINTSDGEE